MHLVVQRRFMDLCVRTRSSATCSAGCDSPTPFQQAQARLCPVSLQVLSIPFLWSQTHPWRGEY